MVINISKRNAFCFKCKYNVRTNFLDTLLSTCDKLHSKERKKHGETALVIFRSGQRSGHQRSSKNKFRCFQHFSTNPQITWEPEELRVVDKYIQ